MPPDNYPPISDTYCTLSEAATNLNCSEGKVQRMLECGELEGLIYSTYQSVLGHEVADFVAAPPEAVRCMFREQYERIKFRTHSGAEAEAVVNPRDVMVRVVSLEASSRNDLREVFDDQAKASGWEDKADTESESLQEAPKEILPERIIRTHKLKARRYAIDAPIETAMKLAANPQDYHNVWAELCKMAESNPPPPPLIGFSSDGVQYKGNKYQSSGEPDIFTKDALRKKMTPSAR
jgi:hypothetical protein